MDKRKIESLARDLTKFVDGETDKFVEWIKKNERRITNAIMSVVNELPTAKDGYVDKVAVNKFNALLVRRINKSMEATGSYDRARALVANFDEIDRLNSILHSFANRIPAEKLLQFASPVKKKIADYTLNNMVGQGYDVFFLTPLKQQIARLATIGTTLNDAVNSLRDYLETKGELTLFGRYAIATGRDALGQYDGALNQKIADEYGLDAYLYVGSFIETTRPQCDRWLAMDYIPKSELDAEIAWAFSNGNGMISGTTAATWAIFRGGYSCRHKAVPVSSANFTNEGNE